MFRPELCPEPRWGYISAPETPLLAGGDGLAVPSQIPTYTLSGFGPQASLFHRLLGIPVSFFEKNMPVFDF